MNARLMPSSLSPLDKLLTIHEQRTGHRPQRAGSGFRISCAACATDSRKVAVTEASNSSVLLHAFCGHTPGEVLAALGLQMGDLFVQRDLRTLSPAERSKARQDALIPRWRAALQVLTHEATVLLIAAGKMGNGDLLDDDELERMRLSATKIRECSEVLHAR